MRRRTFLTLLPALAGAASASCGYSRAGRGSFLPAYIQTIGIPQFVNTTPVYEIEQVFTERVRTEFINRGKYKVQPEATGVDAVLAGEILTIQITPASFTDQQPRRSSFATSRPTRCSGTTLNGCSVKSTRPPRPPTRWTSTRFSVRRSARWHASRRSSPSRW
jgi:hypothetical protein